MKIILKMKKQYQKQEYRFSDKWPEELLKAGYTEIPNILLMHQAELMITSSEMNVIFQCLLFKWTKDNPYPSRNTLAERIGCSAASISRNFRSLERKGIVVRLYGKHRTNEYDFSPLIALLVNCVNMNTDKYKFVRRTLAEMKSIDSTNIHSKEYSFKENKRNKTNELVRDTNLDRSETDYYGEGW